MQLGNFSDLAAHYIHRPAYSGYLVDALLSIAGHGSSPEFKVADIGAGTGKLTKMLLERGVSTIAVEPNDEMLQNGVVFTNGFPVEWRSGSGEATGLPSGNVDWIIMASSFHWTDPAISLPEFHRVLRQGGRFTAVWNPRNIEASELHTRIEKHIYEIAPHIKRVSSGSSKHTKKWEEVLVSTGHFQDIIFMEVDHIEIMTRDRYIGAWNSVNDIRSQAGEESWKRILDAIQKEVRDKETIEVPYKNRAWTGRRV